MTGIWRSSGNWPSAAISTEVDLGVGQLLRRADGRGKQDVVWAAQMLCQQRQAVLLPDEDRAAQGPGADLLRTGQAAQAVVDGQRLVALPLGGEGLGTAEQAFAEGELIGGRRAGQGILEGLGGLRGSEAAQRPGGGLGHVGVGVRSSLASRGAALASRRTPRLQITPTSGRPLSLPSAARKASSTDGSGIGSRA